MAGQIHLGSGGPSTKPLLELYHHSNGDVVLGLEKSPDSGQNTYTLTNVPLGAHWSYVIAITGGKIQVTVNGATRSYPIASGEGQVLHPDRDPRLNARGPVNWTSPNPAVFADLMNMPCGSSMESGN